MRNKEDQGYKNPAYIYDEGRAGGGPDSRSGSSTSSKSSMKIISTKLKGHGRRRWLTIALIVFIVIVIIVAVTTAIYVTRDKESESKNRQRNNQNGTQTTKVTYSSTNFTSTMTRPKTTVSTTKQSTTTTTTTPIASTTSPKVKTTIQDTINATHTSKMSTESTTVSTVSTTTAKTTETQTTTVISRTPSTSSLSPISVIYQTNSSSTIEPPVQGNLSVTMSDVLYNPDDVKTVTLRCQGRHEGDWRTLTIRRQFKDGYEPVAVAVINDENLVEVFKFYPNVTHTIYVDDFDVMLTLNFDPFRCTELTNFTCALANTVETATARANVSIFMPEPLIELPHSIVEDKKVTLRCVAEVWGLSADIVWRFKPEYSTEFMDFSVEPVNNITVKNCSSVINSTLEFNPTMFENGADFRCEIKDQLYHPQVVQKPTNDVKLRVVPSNYCEGKRQFTIHPHPHGPCTLVVYCLDTGPLVYEIECEAGHCYDYVKTACVPAAT